MVGTGPQRAEATPSRAPVYRWECPCRERPVLLATYDAQGRINIKVRDRYWHVHGQVQAICPRCGAEHILDLRETERAAGSGQRAETIVQRPAPGGK